MTTLQNLPTTDAQQDSTKYYFNNLYRPAAAISTGKYDAIISYFQQQTGSIDSAKLMTQAVIDTAEAQRVDPIQLLEQFKKSQDSELAVILALYMNSSRVNTSFLGYKQTPSLNQYVERSIIF